MALCAALSLIPFRFARKWKTWNLYLPAVALAFYGLYEITLPAVDLGGRMAVILPLLFFLCVNGMAKVALLVFLQDRARHQRRHLHGLPQRSLQLLLALPVAAACAAWFWFRMP